MIKKDINSLDSIELFGFCLIFFSISKVSLDDVDADKINTSCIKSIVTGLVQVLPFF